MTEGPCVAPNFVVAGAARSGTTALTRALGSHPEVFMTSPKEVHFFSHAERPTIYGGPGDEILNRSIVSDPASFRRLFAGVSASAVGEGSVCTLYRPKRSIPALERFAAPDCRVVVIVREPAARSHSAYLYMHSKGHEKSTSFAAALSCEPERRRNGWQHLWHYEAMSRYERQLPHFAAVFGDRLHVIVFEEFEADPASEMERLCRFLGIDPSFSFDLRLQVNLGGFPRSTLIASAMNTVRRSSVLKTAARRALADTMLERIRAAQLD